MKLSSISSVASCSTAAASSLPYKENAHRTIQVFVNLRSMHFRYRQWAKTNANLWVWVRLYFQVSIGIHLSFGPFTTSGKAGCSWHDYHSLEHWCERWHHLQGIEAPGVCADTRFARKTWQEIQEHHNPLCWPQPLWERNWRFEPSLRDSACVEPQSFETTSRPRLGIQAEALLQAHLSAAFQIKLRRQVLEILKCPMSACWWCSYRW